jgi:hypothetical protein
VRRLAILALVTGVATAAGLGLDVASASAHICPIAVQILVGRPATIAVGVTVESAPVPDVEITIPAGLRLDRVDAKAGWTFERTGSTVRYRGGPIATYKCAYFSLGVTAPGRGSFGIAVVQRTAAGKVVARSTPNPANASDRILGQIVYAGVKPPSTGSSTRPSAVTIAGIALVVLGVVMVGVLRFRSRRARGYEGGDDEDDRDEDDREAELRERLARFKKQAPGRRSSG